MNLSTLEQVKGFIEKEHIDPALTHLFLGLEKKDESIYVSDSDGINTLLSIMSAPHLDTAAKKEAI